MPRHVVAQRAWTAPCGPNSPPQFLIFLTLAARTAGRRDGLRPTNEGWARHWVTSSGYLAVTSAGERVENGGAGVTTRVEAQRHPHGVHHANHAVTNVVGDDRLNVVLAQESCDSRVVARRRPGVVQLVPRDLDDTPLHDLAVDDFGHRHRLGPSPTRINDAFGGHGNTENHNAILRRD